LLRSRPKSSQKLSQIWELVVRTEQEPSGRARASRSGSTVPTMIAVGLLTILSAVLIAFVIVDNADKESQKTGDGVTLTKAEAKGRELFGRTCAQCHELADGYAVGDIGPNLDQLRPDAALVRNAIEFGRATDRGTMPPGLLSGRDADDVAAFVEVAAKN
jgi:mono/diheme cytochrome c family protein